MNENTPTKYRCIYLSSKTDQLVAGEWWPIYDYENDPSAANHIEKMIENFPENPLWDIETK